MRLNVMVAILALGVSTVAFADTSMMNTDHSTAEGVRAKAALTRSDLSSGRQSAGTDRQRNSGTLHTDFAGTTMSRDRLHRY